MYVLFDKIISNYLSKCYHGAKAVGYRFLCCKEKALAALRVLCENYRKCQW